MGDEMASSTEPFHVERIPIAVVMMAFELSLREPTTASFASSRLPNAPHFDLILESLPCLHLVSRPSGFDVIFSMLTVRPSVVTRLAARVSLNDVQPDALDVEGRDRLRLPTVLTVSRHGESIP